MEKIKFEQEFIVNTSTTILYKHLSTPSGLSEWFADNVNITGDFYTFIWDGSVEEAKILKSKSREFVRFQWEDDYDTDYYFELNIQVDALTQQVALIVKDFAEEDEVEDAKLLWTTTVGKLRRAIGC